jgi:hypothetical protein
MSVGYLDNLVVGSVVVACGVCALLAADGRRAALGGGLLLAGAVIVHWDFAALFTAILVGLLVVLIPESVLAIRRGSPLLSTPSGGVARVLGGAAAGGALAHATADAVTYLLLAVICTLTLIRLAVPSRA